MVRRLGLGLALLISLGALAGVAPAAHADDLLVVPDDFHGSSSVTANVPVESAPYLAVTLNRQGVLARTPVVANAGPGTSISVETWGFTGDTSIGLVGCWTTTSCSSVLATQTRSITQSDRATAVIEAPEATFYYPQEQVFVTAHNAGGGDLRVHATGEVLPSGTRTALNLAHTSWPEDGISIEVQRCSAYLHRACEPPVAQVDTAFLAEVPILVDRLGGPGPLYTNPALRGTTTTFADYGTRGLDFPFDVTWQLEDLGGRVLLGPVDGGTGSWQHLVHVDLAAQGAAHWSGDYVIRFTNTVQTPYGPRSSSVARSVTLQVDPPAAEPPTGEVVDGVVRAARFGYEEVTDEARFAVPGHPASPSDLVIRDARGRVVARAGRTWSWDGGIVPAGRYTASAEIEDRYGRPMTVPLGPVRVLRWMSGRSHRVSEPASAVLRAPAHGSVSRVFRLRAPDVAGRLEHLQAFARLERLRGGRGHVRVAVRVPEVTRAWSKRRFWPVPASAALTRAAGLRFDVRVTVSDGTAVRVARAGAAVGTWHRGS